MRRMCAIHIMEQNVTVQRDKWCNDQNYQNSSITVEIFVTFVSVKKFHQQSPT